MSDWERVSAAFGAITSAQRCLERVDHQDVTMAEDCLAESLDFIRQWLAKHDPPRNPRCTNCDRTLVTCQHLREGYAHACCAHCTHDPRTRS